MKCNVCGKRKAKYFFNVEIGGDAVYAECIWCYGIFWHIINTLTGRVGEGEGK